jgi:hypothetical protein
MTSPGIHLRLEYLVKNKSQSHPTKFYEEVVELDIDKLLVGPPTLPDGENVLGLAFQDLSDGGETDGYILFRVPQLRRLTQQQTEDFDFEIDVELDVLMCLLKITWVGLDAIDGPFTICYRIDQGDFKKQSVPDHHDFFEWELLVKRLSGGKGETYVLLFVADDGPGEKPVDICDLEQAKLADLQAKFPKKKLAIRDAQLNCLIACA